MALVPQFRNVSVTQLKPAPFNPSRRVAVDRLRSLKRSIAEVGILCPLLITKDNDVIDGHRRLAVAKEFGWDTVPCLVSTSESQDKLYAHINTTASHLNGNDTLGVWLNNPKAVSPRSETIIAAVEDAIGRNLLEKMYASGFSIDPYRRALSLMKYCGMQDESFPKKFVLWVLKHRQLRVVINIMASGQSCANVVKAVHKNVALKFSYAIDDK